MRVHSCPDSLRDLVFGPQHRFLFGGHKWRARHYIDSRSLHDLVVRPWWWERLSVHEKHVYLRPRARFVALGFRSGKIQASEKLKDAMAQLGHELDYIIIDDVVGEP